MPNVMHRSKTSPLIKIEKNYQNNEIRRHLNTLSIRDRTSGVLSRGAGTKVHPEPFWERLSKVKRAPSPSNVTEFSSGSHMYLIQGSSQSRIPPQRSSIPHPQKPFKKQALPIQTAPKAIDSKKAVRKPRTKKELPFFTPPQSTQKLNLNKTTKSLKEILQARSACTSNTSAELINLKSVSPCGKSSNASEYYSQSSGFNVEVGSKGISNDSLEEYKMPPLIKVPTTESITSSVNITNDFKDLLEQKNCSMEPDEISVIKNVVKVDNRHHHLQRNDSKLFKVILKSQLKEICKQELVVKNALTKLEQRFSNSHISDTSQELDEIKYEEPFSSNLTKPKVNVIFKNVPTLEKEIIILKALGEKLEATLHRTATTFPANPSKIKTKSNFFGLREVSHFVVGYANNAQVIVQSVGIRLEKGYVKEFRIARKTIVELKENAGKHFYLPVDNEKNELKRTSFRKLKENPDILMRHLKPKNSLVPFNVLDHDPIFFNSFLHNINPGQSEQKKSDEETSKHDDGSDGASSEGVPIREGGDSTIYKQTRFESKSNENKQKLPVIWDDDEDEIEETVKPKYGLMQQREKIKLLEMKEKEFKIWEVGPEEFNKDISEENETKNMLPNEKITKKKKTKEPQITEAKSKSKSKEKNGNKCQSGDSKDKQDTEKEIQSEPEKRKSKKESPTTSPKSSESNLPGSVLFEAPLLGKKRRRIRRCVTPMPMDKEIEPKNRLLKTVLVGIIQMSVFLILIMAITFPDIRCF